VADGSVHGKPTDSMSRWCSVDLGTRPVMHRRGLSMGCRGWWRASSRRRPSLAEAQARLWKRRFRLLGSQSLQSATTGAFVGRCSTGWMAAAAWLKQSGRTTASPVPQIASANSGQWAGPFKIDTSSSARPTWSSVGTPCAVTVHSARMAGWIWTPDHPDLLRELEPLLRCANGKGSSTC